MAWCKLWAGLGLVDVELLKEGCADLGLDGEDYKLVTMGLSLFPSPAARESRLILAALDCRLRRAHRAHAVSRGRVRGQGLQVRGVPDRRCLH